MKGSRAPVLLWSDRVPPGLIPLVAKWLEESPVPVLLSRSRRSKHGDFRIPRNGKQAYITVNHDLHPVEFTVTVAHEIAHYRIWNQYGRRVRPHGDQWKQMFRLLLAEVLNSGQLEKEISETLYRHYFLRARIGSGASGALGRLYGRVAARPEVVVADLPEGTRFRLKSGRIFIKGPKMRTRYQCREAGSRRTYAVHAEAEVQETLVN